MEEKEMELFKRAWLFLARETAAARGFQVERAVVSEVHKKEQSEKQRELA